MIKVKIPKATRFDYESGLPKFWSWCVEHFGQPGPIGMANRRWRIDSYDNLVFDYEEDAVLFTLKWSGNQ